jgi:hypothetical protein
MLDGAYRYRLEDALARAYRTPAGWSWAQGVAVDGTKLLAALEPDHSVSVSRELVDRRRYDVPELVAVPEDAPLLRGARWMPLGGDCEAKQHSRTREVATV